jgi:site-specific DNA-methyltransferase (adenine-specific)
MNTCHKIVIGDSRSMDLIQERSVQLVITSPPYWQLKDYGNESQIGFHDTYEKYINNLNLVWNECHRVLENGCRLCINIGDQFARSVYYGRYKIIPLRTEIIKFCETVGFDYMGAVIWQKVTTSNTTGGATIMGSYPYPRNGILKLDYEFILLFKKQGTPRKVEKVLKEQSKMTKEEWNTYFSGHWNFPGEKQDKHLAMFPPELPNRLIKMFSFVGETVLDPFLGSGTTSLSAKNLKRNSIGYEINNEFLPIIKKKLELKSDQNSQIEICEQNQTGTDYTEKIEQLPYQFKDPVKMDKIIDPRKKQFGSKINSTENGQLEYFSVKEIVSPNTLVLNTGLELKLSGIIPIQDKSTKAKQFLREKTSGQKVFFKPDEEDPGSYFLYLKNKTFLNGHLLRSGFVDLEESNSSKTKFRNFHHNKAYTGGELNRLNGKYGISAPENSVPVMKLIRTHNPKSRSELHELIRNHHISECKCGIKSQGTVEDFGENLFQSQLSEWKEYKYSLKNCIQWEYDLFVCQSLKGNIIEKKAVSLLNNKLRELTFTEADGFLDEELRIDILIKKKSNILGGIQVKPDSYHNVREGIRMRNSSSNEKFGKPVYYLFYDKNENFVNVSKLVKQIRTK